MNFDDDLDIDLDIGTDSIEEVKDLDLDINLDFDLDINLDMDIDLNTDKDVDLSDDLDFTLDLEGEPEDDLVQVTPIEMKNLLSQMIYISPITKDKKHALVSDLIAEVSNIFARDNVNLRIPRSIIIGAMEIIESNSETPLVDFIMSSLSPLKINIPYYVIEAVASRIEYMLKFSNSVYSDTDGLAVIQQEFYKKCCVRKEHIMQIVPALLTNNTNLYKFIDFCACGSKLSLKEGTLYYLQSNVSDCNIALPEIIKCDVCGKLFISNFDKLSITDIRVPAIFCAPYTEEDATTESVDKSLDSDLYFSFKLSYISMVKTLVPNTNMESQLSRLVEHTISCGIYKNLGDAMATLLYHIDTFVSIDNNSVLANTMTLGSQVYIDKIEDILSFLESNLECLNLGRSYVGLDKFSVIIRNYYHRLIPLAKLVLFFSNLKTLDSISLEGIYNPLVSKYLPNILKVKLKDLPYKVNQSKVLDYYLDGDTYNVLKNLDSYSRLSIAIKDLNLEPLDGIGREEYYFSNFTEDEMQYIDTNYPIAYCDRVGGESAQEFVTRCYNLPRSKLNNGVIYSNKTIQDMARLEYFTRHGSNTLLTSILAVHPEYFISEEDWLEYYLGSRRAITHTWEGNVKCISSIEYDRLVILTFLSSLQTNDDTVDSIVNTYLIGEITEDSLIHELKTTGGINKLIPFIDELQEEYKNIIISFIGEEK